MLKDFTILYIEDDIDVLEEISYFLEKKFSTIYLASDGEKGLELFKKFSPDIIITDIQMPKMNGLDMIKKIREENSAIPIIITSAFNETQKLLTAIDLGVDAYLLKPISMLELYERMLKLLSPLLLNKELIHSKIQLVSIQKLQDKEKELQLYIKEKEKIEDKLLESQKRLAKAQEIAHMGSWRWEIDTNKIEWSDEVFSILGEEVQSFEPNLDIFLSYIPQDDVAMVNESIENTLKNKNVSYNVIHKILKKDKTSRYVHQRADKLYDASDIPICMMGTIQDITELKETQLMLEELSITDDLTQLYNRRYFNEIMPKEINRSMREKKNIAFVMLDIDYFKLYNDNYGHLNGDEVLRKIAKVLKTFANRGGDYAFRLGGEEFGLLFFSKTIQSAKVYTQSLIKSIEDLHIVHEHNIVSKYITSSAGLILKECDDDSNFNDLYKKADEALYKAKDSGRNQIYVCESEVY